MENPKIKKRIHISILHMSCFFFIVIILCLVMNIWFHKNHPSKFEYISNSLDNHSKIMFSEDKEYTYRIVDDRYAEIVSWQNYEANKVVIPESIDGYSVGYIGGSAFAFRENLEEVVVPSTVFFIDTVAFANNPKLKTVEILGDNVQNIDEYAFMYFDATILVNEGTKIHSFAIEKGLNFKIVS